jgi:hypothetical protein
VLPLRLTLPFLKQLLHLPLEPEDLRLVDPVLLYKQKVVQLLQYSEEELEALDLCFAEEERHFGATKVVQLLNDGTAGANMAVTTGNREVYKLVLCNYLLTSKIKEQTAAVQRGLAAVIPEPLLGAMHLCISADELDVLIAGQLTIDLDDWQQHAQYKDGYTAESKQVVWFWQIVRSSLCGGCGEGGGGSSSSVGGSSSSSSGGGSSSSSGGGSSSSSGGGNSSSGGVGSSNDNSQKVLVQTLEFATG